MNLKSWDQTYKKKNRMDLRCVRENLLTYKVTEKIKQRQKNGFKMCD